MDQAIFPDKGHHSKIRDRDEMLPYYHSLSDVSSYCRKQGANLFHLQTVPLQKAYAIPFFLVLFCLVASCSQAPSSVETSLHPIETSLIPQVQIVSKPITYSLEERLETHNITGFALGIIDNNALTLDKGYGWAQKEKQIAVDKETIFAAGSISKSITGLMALRLEEQDILSLDEDISSYLSTWQLPDSRFTEKEKITLRHLLNHQAGINPFNSKGILPSQPSPSLSDILLGNEVSPGVSIDTISGSVYRYSNLGFGIVQLALTDLTGKPFEQLAKELAFDPLGMKNSSFADIEPTDLGAQYAVAYDDEGQVYEESWRKSLIKASGGLRSTIGDLSTFLFAIAAAREGKAGHPISQEIAQQIFANQGYNLGFEIEGEQDDLSITHTGRVPGYFAYMRLYPNTGKGIIMLCNSDNGGEIFKDILRGASEIYDWEIMAPKEIEVVDLSTEELQPFVGEYELILGGDSYVAQINLEGGQLIYSMKGEAERYPMRPIDSHVFVDLIDGDEFTFISRNDSIVQVNTNGEYTFDRI